MKGSKWYRLGVGVGLLAMLFVLQGTSASHKVEGCVLCLLENTRGLGYLQVSNHTPYNIIVHIKDRYNQYGPYMIKTTPSFIRTEVSAGACRVYVFVCTPTPDQTPVYYKYYSVNAPGNFETVSVTVSTPIGYFPIPK